MNGFKTMLLLSALTALFMGLGYMFGGAGGAVIALVIAAGMNLFTYWNADKIVLRMHNAKEVGPDTKFYRLVATLAKRANMPVPKVYIVEDPHPNAFATGRNPENAAVAATSGLLDILNEQEIAGVMAHELAHVKNRDTLVMTMVATIAGAISMLANFGLFFRSDDNRGNALAMIAAVIVAPFAAMIVQMAISRTREFGADRGGAEISGNPAALASALEKLQHGAARIPNHVVARNPATAQLYIVPTSVKEMFSTHPATEKRIAALEKIADEMGLASPPPMFAEPPVVRRSSVPSSRPAPRRGSALDPLGRRD